ncbi:hypothetical protein TNCV_1646081 [Trichonephila clavipes]|nr:hypothetical protein TNCV_1646081 [Trichonephila clavipes]
MVSQCIFRLLYITISIPHIPKGGLETVDLLLGLHAFRTTIPRISSSGANLNRLCTRTPVATEEDLTAVIVVVSADITSTPNLLKRVRQSFVNCATTCEVAIFNTPCDYRLRCICDIESSCIGFIVTCFKSNKCISCLLLTLFVPLDITPFILFMLITQTKHGLLPHVLRGLFVPVLPTIIPLNLSVEIGPPYSPDILHHLINTCSDICKII